MRFKGGHVVASVGLLVCGCSPDVSENSGASPLSQPTSWVEVEEALGQLAASASMIAAEVAADGSLTLLHERGPDEARAIGVSFSIYVLGAVSDRIAGGDMSWDDELTITAGTESLPPGELRDRPIGSTVTVREAALVMMSESDNTAVDLLIDAVGREQVEHLIPAMGMGEESQARTLPLLKTRERFIITLDVDAASRAEYASGGESARRRLLSGLPTDLPVAGGADNRKPVDIETIGWFASPVELAKAQLWIDSQRGLPGQEPLEEILASVPGVPLVRTLWSAFSCAVADEPGVLSLSCLLQRADGRRFVIALVANDSDGAVDAASGRSITAGMIGLLASV